ncbi:MAG: hypothetical protein IT374_25945 [Polyangiaceae bacterium]|nr:hypothetical protein [Polyangiaceae bacterium]
MTATDLALAEFSADDYTTRLTHAIFKVVPFAPAMQPYRSTSEAIDALYPQATPEMRARVAQLGDSEETKSALWVASAIDTGDTGIAVFSGIKSALGLFFGDKKSDALDTDSAQGVDAVLKLLGVSYLAYKLFPGSIAERAQLFHTAPAGQAMLLYFAAVEVALPFTDNALGKVGGLSGIIARWGGEAAGKLSALGGAGMVTEAQTMATTLTAPADGVIGKVMPFASSIAASAKQYLPSVAVGVDTVAGVVATGADALPVYKYLCARLAAEAAVLRASRGLLYL